MSALLPLFALLLSEEDEPASPLFVQRHFPFLAHNTVLRVGLWQWVAMAAALVTAVLVGFAFSRLFFLVSRALSKHPRASWFVSFIHAVQNSLAALVALGVFDAAVHFSDLTGHVSLVVDTIARQVLIGCAAWLAIVGGASLTSSLEQDLAGVDEFASRGVRTQLRVAHRLFSILVVIIAVALILSGIHSVRNIGVSLLASAGVASVVIGLAAQKTLGAVLAGIQLSITQPVRLGDTVVVDTEFGTVEEIHLTFVVLRLWDMRRLIVPVNRFLDTSFQSWTRVRSNLLGTVEFSMDATTPVADVRAEAARLCKESKLWDKNTCTVSVTDASDKSLKLRILVSAENEPNLFALRSEIREGLVAFLQVKARKAAPSAVAPGPSVGPSGAPSA